MHLRKWQNEHGEFVLNLYFDHELDSRFFSQILPFLSKNLGDGTFSEFSFLDIYEATFLAGDEEIYFTSDDNGNGILTQSSKMREKVIELIRIGVNDAVKIEDMSNSGGLGESE
jgi:hypothetical protein